MLQSANICETSSSTLAMNTVGLILNAVRMSGRADRVEAIAG
jgi:hypothetical protein